MNGKIIKKILFIMIFISTYTYSKENSVLIVSNLMDMDFEELMEIEITSSTKSSRKISNAPSTITVYLAEDIRKMGARTISDILWSVAGIQSQIKHNNRQKVWIRGVQSEFNNKIALYIDNVPYRDVFGGFSIDEEIPIESIKKIEIIRGPGSALYGANAFSGVINIFTFKPSDKQNKILKASVGSQSSKFGYVLAKDENDFAKFILEAKSLKTDGRKPEFDRYGGKNFRSAKQNLDYIKFQSSTLNDELLFGASYSQFNNYRVDKPISADDGRTHNNLRLWANYNHKFNNDFKIDSTIYHTEVKRVEYEHGFEFTDNQQNLIESYDYTDEIALSGLNLALNYNLTTTNEMVAGVEVKREALVDSSFVDNLTNKKYSFIEDERYKNIILVDIGTFIQDTQSFFDDQTKFTIGARFDNLDLFDNQFSYRLGLTHSLNENLFVKLLYGTAYRSANFIEFTRAPKDSQLPDVEKLKTLEAQIGYQTKKSSLNLTLYQNYYDDFIYRKNSFYESPQNLRAGVFDNIDNQKIYGFEVESKFILNKNFNSFLNFSWLNAKSTVLNEEIPLLADWILSFGGDFKKKFNGNEFLFHNEFIIYGDRKDWPDTIWEDGVDTRYSNRGNDFSDGFITINSGIHYKINLKESQINLDVTVHNLFDSKYYTQSITPPRSDRTAYFDTEFAGRHLRFNISYSW